MATKRRGKKLSVDNMRPPAAASFVIFLSSNSHFRMLLLSSLLLFLSLSLSPILSLLKLIIEFYNRMEQKEVVNAAAKKRRKNGAKENTCLLVVNSFSPCSINCNVAFVYLHVVATAATAAVAVHLITQLSGLCKVHVVWSTFFLLLLHRNHFAVKTM